MDKEIVRVPITDVFDLHSLPPRYARAAVEAYLEEARRLGFTAVRIIHGKGVGVQREMVRTVLGRTPFVVRYGDAPVEAGGWGATVVEFGERPAGYAAYVAEMEALTAEARALAAKLDEDGFWRRPGRNRWSAGECLAHLNVTNGKFAQAIEDVIARGRREGITGAGPFHYGLLERWFLWVVGPPARLKVKAPVPFQPERGAKTKDAVLEEFARIHARLAQLWQEAQGLDLARLKVRSPAGPLKISLGIQFQVVAAHDRRHLRQAAQASHEGPAESSRG
jgi:hypothetical protein